MKPYFTSEKEIYFTDGAAEVLVDTFDDCVIASKVCSLLNDTYKDAYQDGFYASLKDKYKELLDKITALTIENDKLKNKIK